MQAHLPNATVFDMGLTGRETQESFELEKYIALAYSSAKGVQLAELVELDHVIFLRHLIVEQVVLPDVNAEHLGGIE